MYSSTIPTIHEAVSKVNIFGKGYSPGVGLHLSMTQSVRANKFVTGRLVLFHCHFLKKILAIFYIKG